MGQRTRADEPPAQVRIPRGVAAKTDKVRLFMAANPFFTRDEIVARMGVGIEPTLTAMAADNRIKQAGTHVFCDPRIDAGNREVEALILFTGSSRISADRMARRARKGLLRPDRPAELPTTSPEVRLRNWIKTNRVFSRSDARRKLGTNPGQAIAKLLQKREISTLFPGTYVYYGILPERRYEAYRDYVHEKSKAQTEAILAIDASQARSARGPFVAAPMIRSIDDEFKPWLGRRKVRQLQNGAKMQARIWLNFHNLETIYAIAGGENNTMPVWKPKKGTQLTDAAAAAIAAQIFPANFTFGQLCALAKDVRDGKVNLPEFRPGGRFDHSPRFGEIQRGRYMTHRQGKGFAMPAQCTLTVDTREDARIIEALHGIHNLDVNIATLETGDYLFQWGPDENAQVMLVERKAGEDFGASIANGSMAEQMGRIKKLGCRRYLLAEGRIFENDGSERGDANDREKTKWMAWIGMVMPVVSTPNWQRTVDMLLILARGAMLASGVPDLSEAGADPRTASCGNQGSTAAGSPDGSSSE